MSKWIRSSLPSLSESYARLHPPLTADPVRGVRREHVLRQAVHERRLGRVRPRRTPPPRPPAPRRPVPPTRFMRVPLSSDSLRPATRAARNAARSSPTLGSVAQAQAGQPLGEPPEHHPRLPAGPSPAPRQKWMPCPKPSGGPRPRAGCRTRPAPRTPPGRGSRPAAPGPTFSNGRDRSAASRRQREPRRRDLHRPVEAHDLLDGRGREPSGPSHSARHCPRAQQRPQPVDDHVDRRLLPGDQQQLDHRDQLVALELVERRQPGDQVVRGRAARSSASASM